MILVSLADPVGGLRGLQPPPLNFQKNSDHPRGRCDRFSCYFIKHCVFVFVEWCCWLNRAHFCHDCLAEAAPTRALSRRLDRSDRMIQNESRDSNGGNVRAATCTSQCKLCSLRAAHSRLSALLYTFRE